MKNSSRLLAEIDRNRTRSSSGWLGLSASSSTRRLKWSHDNSRLTNRSGPAGVKTVAASVPARFDSSTDSNDKTAAWAGSAIGASNGLGHSGKHSQQSYDAIGATRVLPLTRGLPGAGVKGR